MFSSRFIQIYAIAFLSIIHLVGLFLFFYNKENASLTYVNLIVTAVVLFLMQSKKVITPLIIIFLGGFFIEWIGVNFGFLFGDYEYGSALGLHVYGVPLVIGLNWYAVVISSCSWVNLLSTHIVLKALIAALICTLLDVLIEPVAIHYDFWSWKGNVIPLFNYVCWFCFSFVFTFINLKFVDRPNKTASALFIIWIVFFSSLNLIS